MLAVKCPKGDLQAFFDQGITILRSSKFAAWREILNWRHGIVQIQDVLLVYLALALTSVGKSWEC